MIEKHEGREERVHTFDHTWERLNASGAQQLATRAGTPFVARAAITTRGQRRGERVIRYFQDGQEYGRSYECCWEHYYNCNRTRIGMYTRAVDKWVDCKARDNSMTSQEQAAEFPAQPQGEPQGPLESVPTELMGPTILVFPVAEALRTTGRLASRHSTLFLAVMVFYVSLIGGSYMWGLLRMFGINVMDFAQGVDFLLIGFRQPLAIVYALGAVVVFNHWLAGSRHRAQAAGRTNSIGPKVRRVATGWTRWWMWALMLATYTFIGPWSLAYLEAAHIKRATQPGVIVQLADDADKSIPSSLGPNTALICTTDTFVFFYDRDEQLAHIVPIGSIVQMYYASAGSPAASATPRSDVTRIPSDERPGRSGAEEQSTPLARSAPILR